MGERLAYPHMTCSTCGRTKHRFDGFPNTIFAECWDCWFVGHLAREHKDVVKRIRNTARKRMKTKLSRVTDADLREHVFGKDREVFDRAASVKNTQS